MLGSIGKRFLLGRVAKRLPIFKVLAIAEVAMLARRHVQMLGPEDRRRFADLVKRGRHLSPAEKDELRAITMRLEPRAFAGAAADSLSPVPLPRRLTGLDKHGKPVRKVKPSAQDAVQPPSR